MIPERSDQRTTCRRGWRGFTKLLTGRRPEMGVRPRCSNGFLPRLANEPCRPGRGRGFATTSGSWSPPATQRRPKTSFRAMIDIAAHSKHSASRSRAHLRTSARQFRSCRSCKLRLADLLTRGGSHARRTSRQSAKPCEVAKLCFPIGNIILQGTAAVLLDFVSAAKS